MATVKQLVEAISKVTKVPEKTVNNYARALIDAGELPKSRGRSLAQAEPKHITKLIIAAVTKPKLIDVVDAVKARYDTPLMSKDDPIHREAHITKAGILIDQLVGACWGQQDYYWDRLDLHDSSVTIATSHSEAWVKVGHTGDTHHYFDPHTNISPVKSWCEFSGEMISEIYREAEGVEIESKKFPEIDWSDDV